MGKKYIIEIPEDNIADFIGDTHFLMPYMLAGHMGSHDTRLPIEPYTEPDLEQVRKEAYEAGAKSNAIVIADDKAHEAYQRGLADAWEAARKIVCDEGIDMNTLCTIFRRGCSDNIIRDYSASEAIAKIKEYEQEQEYHVGDEFENGDGRKFVVIKMDGKEIDRYIDGDGKTYVMKEKYRVMRKTGRSFPEIAAVLEKMRGE